MCKYGEKYAPGPWRILRWPKRPDQINGSDLFWSSFFELSLRFRLITLDFDKHQNRNQQNLTGLVHLVMVHTE